ncbi:inactive protein RESTRICTED TEV MOVEMENT 2-like [Cannabis sativa]|uniref:inactive protein RESTRICTED TEV MOVEMENT 2-like n=1 Tax=Cannabis sativa TaxID=3483 RepID=UPI0029C9F335|nr:inactive protein RESTRICTED TEV MOVEMENT 2-like [Cannabis sativa]
METIRPGTASVNQNKSYEEFEPPLEWVKEETSDTLLVFLPGFQKEKLKIQITSTGKLRISGERLISQNKWRRFIKEFELDLNCDTSKISAKFEGGILYVKVPKPTTKTTTQPPRKPTPTPTPTTTPTPTPTPSLPAHQDQKRQRIPTPPPPPPPTSILKQQPDRVKPINKDHINNGAAEADHDRRRKELLDDTAAKTMPAQADHDHKKKVTMQTLVASKDDDDMKKKKKIMPSTSSSADDHEKKLLGLDDKAGVACKPGEGLAEKAMRPLQSLSVKKFGVRTLVNSALAVLFVGVLALYVRNIFIRTFGGGSGENKSSSEL